MCRRFEFVCPHCGAKVDDHASIGEGDVDPEPGHVSICLHCSGLAIFTPLGLRVCTDEEWRSIMAQDDVQKAIAAIAAVRAQGGIPPCPTSGNC